MQINNLSTAVVQRHTSDSLEGEAFTNSPQRGTTNGCAQQAHGRGIVPPEVHGVLDYPLAAIIIAGPLVFDFDSTAATVIALAFGAGAAVLAVGTAWPTGIVRVIRPLLHGYADVIVTVALILLPFILGFDDSTAALLFYEIVGGAGLLATLATRFEPRVPETRAMTSPQAA